MCLSTVYKNEMKKENILMSNVSSVEVLKDAIVLTDLMERKKTLKGTILKADLLENYIIVALKEEENGK